MTVANVAVRVGRYAKTAAMLGVSLWAFFAYIAHFAGASYAVRSYAPLLGLLCWWLGHSFATLLHELGHAVAARACGWRIVIFTVRPIRVKVSRMELAWVPRSELRGFGGWVTAVPQSREVGTRLRYALFVAAGPLVMAGVAAIAFVGSAIGWSLPPDHGVSINPLAVAFGLQATSSCIFSLLPSGRANRASDGDVLLAMRRADGSWPQRPVIWMQTLLNANVRLRDLPPWMIAAARAMPSPSDEVTQALDTIDIGIALDTVPVDAARARRMIDDHRARYGASEWLDSVDAYLAAMWEGDGPRARATLWSGARSEGLRPMVMAAEAAVAAREGDAATARSRLIEVRRAVRAQSRFYNATFHDIGRQIEGLLA